MFGVSFPFTIFASLLLKIECEITESGHNFKSLYGVDNILDNVIINFNQNTDFLYIFTGDSQFWWQCTPQNYGCWQNTVEECKVDQSKCIKAHGEYANRHQETSMRALIKRLASKGMRPRGLIINGDITQFGHNDELDRYKWDYLPRREGVVVYPGLGNHDYVNNINKCALNHCFDRMIKWFYEYMTQKLFLPMHLVKSKVGFWQLTTKWKGSLSYSWSECLITNPSKCVRFIQLNNHPGFKAEAKSILNDFVVTDSYEWLAKEMRLYKNQPFVINFHDFDTLFDENEKKKLKDVLQLDKGYRILSINFAHFHTRFGLHPFEPSWCINGANVPLLYVGSIPANNYLLKKYTLMNDNVTEQIYAFHVNDQDNTDVFKINFNDKC